MKMISNFIKGELPLWKSFWIVGILMGIIGAIISIALYALLGFLIVKNIVFLVGMIFWTVGVWRSGRDYIGMKSLVFLSRLSCLLGIASEVFNLVNSNFIFYQLFHSFFWILTPLLNEVILLIPFSFHLILQWSLQWRSEISEYWH